MATVNVKYIKNALEYLERFNLEIRKLASDHFKHGDVSGGTYNEGRADGITIAIFEL